MPTPRAAQIALTDAERAELEGWKRRRTSAAGLALRAKIVLAAADGGTNVELSERLGVDRSTIRKWRNRFSRYRCDGLLDEPRPGRPRIVGDDQIEALITATLETTPPDATHWSTRSMATHFGAIANPWFRGCGGHSDWLRTNRIRGNCPRISCSSPRSATSYGLIPEPPGARAGAVCGRKDPDPGAQPHRSRCFRCCPARRRGPATTTCATAPRVCMPLLIRPPDRSSAPCTPVTARPRVLGIPKRRSTTP